MYKYITYIASSSVWCTPTVKKFFLQMSAAQGPGGKEALLALPSEENGEELEHAPKGLEQFETMDDEEMADSDVTTALNGLSLNTI